MLSLILLSSYISCSYCALFFSSNAAISQALKKRCQNMSLFQFSSSSISPMFLNRHSDYHILVVLVAENCLESAVLQQINITIGSNTVGLSAKACGLRKPCFDPEKGFRREFRGANGIGNGDFEPASPTAAQTATPPPPPTLAQPPTPAYCHFPRIFLYLRINIKNSILWKK